VKKHTPPAAKNDREDLVQVALERAWKCTHLPDDDLGCIQYTCGIAKRVAKQWRRNEIKRSEVGGEAFDENLDVHSNASRSSSSLEQAIADREHLARLQGEVKKSEERALAWMLRNAAGESYYAIAGEEGVPYPTVYAAAQRLSKRFKQIVVLLFGLSTFGYIFYSQGVMVPRDNVTHPNDQPYVEARPASGTPAAQAFDLRKEAELAFARSDWKETLRLLSEAEALDPNGDNTPKIQRERHAAQQALDEEEGQGR
jgi:DNA-directed RNA polymerase specialized sigma24 family protein